MHIDIRRCYLIDDFLTEHAVTVHHSEHRGPQGPRVVPVALQSLHQQLNISSQLCEILKHADDTTTVSVITKTRLERTTGCDLPTSSSLHRVHKRAVKIKTAHT